MKYSVGDIVKVKSYEALVKESSNYCDDSIIPDESCIHIFNGASKYPFLYSMKQFCGKSLVIDQVHEFHDSKEGYYICSDGTDNVYFKGHRFTDYMFE